MAGNIDGVVVDASVILALLLAEQAGDVFVPQLENIKKNGGVLYAPCLLFYEVLNGLKSNVIRNRIGRDDIEDIWERFLKLKVEFVNQEEVGKDIAKLSVESDLTGYDASYVVLARKLGVRLMSLDEKLMKKV